MEMKNNGAGGEIVPIHGGHIIRSTNRKDRHSKVYTAKGPRDRRVRLSAQTAIQFYDVQDRLGYDRPSKAVDWLIDKAKTAIDKLDKLPPWNPYQQPIDDDTLFANPNLIKLGQKLENSGSYQQNPTSSSSSSPNLTQPVDVRDNMKFFMPSSSISYQNYPMVEAGNACYNSSYNCESNQMVFSGSAPANFSATMMDWNGEGGLGFFSGQFQPEGFSGFQIPAKFQGDEFGVGSGKMR